MKVSIIIPTYNPGLETVRLLVERLQAQRLPYHELIVIDSSSTDSSLSGWPSEHGKQQCIPKEDFDHGRTRNLGAKLAEGEVLVFMTQDAVPSNECWLEKLIEPLMTGEAVAAFARQLPKEDAGPLEVFSRTFNYPEASLLKGADDVRTMGIKAYFFSNVCSAVMADAFWEVGGFPERTILNEDMILSAKLMQAGHKVKYAAEAQVYHSHNYSLIQQFRRNFDIGVSVVQAGALLEGAGAGGAGLRFVSQQLKYVVRSGHPWLLPQVMLESGVKFLAFQLGMREKWLANDLKKRLSMHRYHWDQAEPQVLQENQERATGTR